MDMSKSLGVQILLIYGMLKTMVVGRSHIIQHIGYSR